MATLSLLNTVCCSSYLEFLKNVDDSSVDVAITDPPFGVAYQNNYTFTKHDVLQGDNCEFSYAHLARELFRVLKPNSACFVFTGWSVYPKHFAELSDAGFKMKEPIIGQKRASGTSDLYGSFQTNCDWLLFAHKGRFTFQQTQLVRNKKAGVIPNPGRKPVPEFKTRFPSCWFGDEYPLSSENSGFQSSNDIYHPTIKGREFVEWLIKLTTPIGGVVIDPFVGSGTTAVAARLTDRNFLASEIESKFVEYANKRLRMGF